MGHYITDSDFLLQIINYNPSTLNLCTHIKTLRHSPKSARPVTRRQRSITNFRGSKMFLKDVQITARTKRLENRKSRRKSTPHATWRCPRILRIKMRTESILRCTKPSPTSSTHCYSQTLRSSRRRFSSCLSAPIEKLPCCRLSTSCKKSTLHTYRVIRFFQPNRKTSTIQTTLPTSPSRLCSSRTSLRHNSSLKRLRIIPLSKLKK